MRICILVSGTSALLFQVMCCVIGKGDFRVEAVEGGPKTVFSVVFAERNMAIAAPFMVTAPFRPRRNPKIASKHRSMPCSAMDIVGRRVHLQSTQGFEKTSSMLRNRKLRHFHQQDIHL